MIKAVIIDDEESGRETLQYIFNNHFPDQVVVAGKAANLTEGVKLIEQSNPDVVFLDIEMPNELGLSIVNHFFNINFEIIVTTAYRDYGIEAIKINVLDYLLKPIDIDELAKTIQKLETVLYTKLSAQARQDANATGNKFKNPEKIPLSVSNSKIIFIEPKTIVRCEAGGNYTTFYFTDGKKEIVTKLIKDVELMLDNQDFFRVHKSHLINLNSIKSYQKNEDQIIMSDNSVIPLSKNSKAHFLKLMRIKL